ncbi:MAG: hypothetical protein IKZ53_05665 [Selenomonadaceae bacterium]|nr:hypothetical protein [Selenomonadaceae bacterium]
MDDLDELVMKLAGYFTLIDIMLRFLKATEPKKRKSLKKKRRRRRKR